MAWDIKDWLSSLLGPREAEAEVLTTPSGQQMMQGLQAQPSGDYLLDMYKRILDRAQAVPQTVSVLPDPQLMAREQAVGSFDPEANVIRYQTGKAPASTWNTLGHELLHFLNQQTAQVPVETQHALMDRMLGAAREVHPAVYQNYQPEPLTPVEHYVLRQWLTGERDYPGR